MKNNPLGFWNGPMLPANAVQRYAKKWRAPDAFVIPMQLEHGGWTAETETDRILKRFILAERCGLSIQIDKQTGRAEKEKARWILTTGETIYDEHPIESVPFEDVSIQRLNPNQSIDLNISSARRVGGAAAASGIAWWASAEFGLAEHLPAVGEIALVMGVSLAVLAEERIRVGLRWKGDSYAVGSIIAYGMSVVDSIRNDLPIFPPAEGD